MLKDDYLLLNTLKLICQVQTVWMKMETEGKYNNIVYICTLIFSLVTHTLDQQ